MDTVGAFINQNMNAHRKYCTARLAAMDPAPLSVWSWTLSITRSTSAWWGASIAVDLWTSGVSITVSIVDSEEDLLGVTFQLCMFIWDLETTVTVNKERPTNHHPLLLCWFKRNKPCVLKLTSGPLNSVDQFWHLLTPQHRTKQNSLVDHKFFKLTFVLCNYPGYVMLLLYIMFLDGLDRLTAFAFPPCVMSQAHSVRLFTLSQWAEELWQRRGGKTKRNCTCDGYEGKNKGNK